jgi:hypothetical protein
MNKKEKYLNFVKEEIRKRTYCGARKHWSDNKRYYVGGVIPLSEGTIKGIDETIKDGYLNVITSPEIMSTFCRRMKQHYGIESENEIIFIMEGYYEWFMENKIIFKVL